MTNGIVTIINEKGQIIAKIITGSNGMKASDLAKSIRKNFTEQMTAKDLYQMALDAKFGTEDSLVVLTGTKSFHKTGERLNHLYRKTFNTPEFNPRWKCGLSDFVEIVNL